MPLGINCVNFNDFKDYSYETKPNKGLRIKRTHLQTQNSKENRKKLIYATLYQSCILSCHKGLHSCYFRTKTFSVAFYTKQKKNERIAPFLL
jgi:hypothetical protein